MLMSILNIRLKELIMVWAVCFFEEIPVDPYVKDLSVYERAMDYEKEFDINNWRFYMAFDGEQPIGAMTVVGRTEGLNMLSGRNDACVLWDIRVADPYKHNGI